MGEKMDEIELMKERLKRKHQNFQTTLPQKNKSKAPINQIFTHVLIAVIFVLISTIYIEWSESNKEMYKKHVFETSLSFTNINSWYEKVFGSSLPIDLQNNTISVNNTTMDFNEITKYQDGVSVSVAKDSAITALNSGIVVFIGEKENYGNVVIVQGIDGVDIWYGNITNVNLSLYDYVEKNGILGSANATEIYFVIQKDNNYLDYEEYKSQI